MCSQASRPERITSMTRTLALACVKSRRQKRDPLGQNTASTRSSCPPCAYVCTRVVLLGCSDGFIARFRFLGNKFPSTTKTRQSGNRFLTHGAYRWSREGQSVLDISLLHQPVVAELRRCASLEMSNQPLPKTKRKHPDAPTRSREAGSWDQQNQWSTGSWLRVHRAEAGKEEGDNGGKRGH